MNSLVSPDDFLNLQGKTHLYTAAEGPLPRTTARAITLYTTKKSEAEEGRKHHDAVTAACRLSVASLFGVEASDIALVGSASEAINAVAGILDFAPGDNVVINDLEFMSVALPWMRMQAEGLEVRVIRHENWEIPTSLLLSAVDERTVLLALSHVSFVNGWRHDVATISAALKGTRTKFLLDVTQSAGIFPIQAKLADFVVSSTYKWLLGTHGLGLLYVNSDQEALRAPKGIGWYSITSTTVPDRYERYNLREGAGKFETGYLNFSAIYALNASLSYLQQLDSATVISHVHALGDELIAGLKRLCVRVITPESTSFRGASVTVLHRDADRIGSALAQQNIHAWAGDGRLRASPNIFTSSHDVARYLDAVAGCL